MRKHIGIAIVAVLAVIGSTVSVLTLSAQEPGSLATVVATHDAAIGNVKYCDPRTDGITVQGAGVVTIPANIGVVELGVDVIADPLVDARSTAAAAMQSIIDAVKEQGVTDDQITTTRLNIRPERTWIEEEFDLGDGSTGRRSRDVVIGYRVSNRVRIEIDVAETSEDENGDILSAVIDAAATAGGDNVRIDSISLRADQTSESVDEARKLAVADTLHRANLYAEAFGVEVGTLLSASESVDSRPVFDNFALAKEVVVESDAFDGPSTPVSAGDVEVRASITAKFAIAQPGCVDKKVPAVDKDADGNTE
ncbi:MAG: SIMPL domain-containing protein [Chloroflexi bacterium]|nr:SIMPL domain-containing protein [Chloroflexota bacterium]